MLLVWISSIILYAILIVEVKLYPCVSKENRLGPKKSRVLLKIKTTVRLWYLLNWGIEVREVIWQYLAQFTHTITDGPPAIKH